MYADQIITRVMVEMAEKELEIGFIKDISNRLHEYKQQGQDVSDVTLQRIPGGFYSKEVAEFVGRLLTVGLVTQENPIILNQEGIGWLKRMCKNETA
jgi:hypothetical protein